MQNPFEQGGPALNYRQFIRDQVSTLEVGESKFVDAGGKNQSSFSATLQQVNGYKFKTKSDKENKTGYWVLRVS